MSKTSGFVFVCENCGREIALKRPQQMIACKCGVMQSKDFNLHSQPFSTNKLGIVYTSVQKVGGAETFLRTMMHVLSSAISGVAVLSPTIHSHGLRHGLSAIHDLVAASDCLLVWGFTEGLDSIVTKYPQKKIYAIHHGDLASTWANQMFALQLQITGHGIAVNKEVALRFGVNWLPNPVLRPTFEKTPNSTKKPRVLWNHRWSNEKRPELAVEIARELGDAVEFAISAPPSIELPANCQNIGQTTSNVNWLSGTDVFLSTANQEAFGYSLAEAAYVGVPIVASPYGIAKNVATQIVESEDAKQWAQAVLAAVGSDASQAATWIDQNHGCAAVEQWAGFVGADIASLSKPKPALRKANAGPGTELEKILKLFGINPKIGCGCKSIKNKMNRWGVDGCRVPENHAWIVNRLTVNAEKYSWRDTITAAANLALHPSLWSTHFLIRMAVDGWIEALVEEAIRRAACVESAKL